MLSVREFEEKRSAAGDFGYTPYTEADSGVRCDINTRESGHCVETLTAFGTVRTHMRIHRQEIHSHISWSYSDRRPCCE